MSESVTASSKRVSTGRLHLAAITAPDSAKVAVARSKPSARGYRIVLGQVSWLTAQSRWLAVPVHLHQWVIAPSLAAYSCGGSASISLASLLACDSRRRNQSNYILGTRPKGVSIRFWATCMFFDFARYHVAIEPSVFGPTRRLDRQGAGITPENWEAGEIPALPPQR